MNTPTTETTTPETPIASHAYPLWCVDRRNKSETQYRGPFDSFDKANAARNEMIEEAKIDGTFLSAEIKEFGLPVVRRCRRVLISCARAIELDTFFEDLVEAIDMNMSEDPPVADGWADWEDPLVQEVPVEPGMLRLAQQEMTEAIDRYLRLTHQTMIFECEPTRSKGGDSSDANPVSEA